MLIEKARGMCGIEDANVPRVPRVPRVLLPLLLAMADEIETASVEIAALKAEIAEMQVWATDCPGCQEVSLIRTLQRIEAPLHKQDLPQAEDLLGLYCEEKQS